MVSMQIACLINVTIGFRLLPFVYPALLEERIVSLFLGQFNYLFNSGIFSSFTTNTQVFFFVSNCLYSC